MLRDVRPKTAPITLDRIQATMAKGPIIAGSSDFDLNADTPPPGAKYRPAAVLIPIIQQTDGLKIILTQRAAHLKHHPGQVAFPGGKVDAADKDAESAALREAHEEIGLSPSYATLLGTLPPHKTVTGFEVQPIVAAISSVFSHRLDPSEVEEVFYVPVDHVLNAENYFIEGRIWMGKTRRYYVVPYGPYYIWGATARMLRMFAEYVSRSNADHS
jgi:8-oxo-dGTP pyrophosphatase MutT (NUDIX family)